MRHGQARAVGGVDLATDPPAWLTGPAGDRCIALDVGQRQPVRWTVTLRGPVEEAPERQESALARHSASASQAEPTATSRPCATRTAAGV